MIKSLIQSNNNKDIKIDLSKQLLNCNKDEIDGIIFNSNMKNLDDMKEEVFKKIVPTFSQDLIIFASNSIFASKYPDDFKTILSIYNSTEHRNLNLFLKNMKNSKNVIYTFSHILEALMKGLEVNNEIYGIINNDTIYKKIIENNCSEKIIEKTIQSFINSDKQNVLIFQIQSYNCEHLNHIQFVYENYLKSEENINKTKAIIFIIYLERDIHYLKNDNIITNTNFISHLSSFEQTFIDNLNGKDFLITELIGLKNSELYKNHKIYNINEQFNKLIFPAFTTISYDIDNVIEDISFENYYERVIEKLMKNDELKEKIKNKLLDFIEKESTSLLYSTFYGNNFEKNDIDFISILTKNLDYTLKYYLIKFIVKSERDGVFPILLSTNFDIEEIKILSEQYFNKIDISNVNIRTQIKENRVNTILGLNIPMIKDTIYKLNLSTEEIKNNFFMLEDDFRNEEIEEEDKEKEIEKQNKAIQEIESKENKMYQNIKFECERIDLFKFVLERKNNNTLNNKIFSLIQDDFYTIYIINKFKHKNISHIKTFLNYIISLKLPQNENINDFLFFSQTILWLKSYEDIINGLLRIFDELHQVVPNILDLIKEIIDNKYVDYSEEKNNEQYKKIINEPFYSLIEGILESIFMSFINILELNEEKLQNYFEALKSTLQVLFQIRHSLSIVIRRIFILSQIVKISENLKIINKRTFDNLKEYISFINKEIKYFKDSLKDEYENELKNEFLFIKNIFEKDYPNIIIDIFCDKYRQIPDKNYRKILFEIILEDDYLLVKSKKLFSLLIKYNDELIPKSLYDENYEKDNDDEEDENDDDNEENDEFLSFCEDDNNEILNMINNKENIILDEIFLYLFETKINKYFNTIDENNKDTEGENNKYVEKLKSLSFKYLKKSIDFIEEKEVHKSKPLYHLGLIYSIAYLKCYFYNYVDILVNYHAQLGSAETIESYLFDQKKEFRNVIKIYLLKLLYHSHFNIYDEFYNEISKEQYKNWFDIQNIEKENKDKKSILEILSFDVNLIEKYKSIEKDFLDINKKEDCLNLIKEKIENFYSFIDLSINNILSLYKEPEKNNDDNINYLETILNEYDSNKINSLNKIFLNKELFNSKLKNKIETININEFYGLLISFKISIQCLFLKENSFYSKLMSNNIKTEIENSYLPGGTPNINLIIKSYYDIKSDLELNNNASNGCYICSCNYFYTIAPCGLPNQIFKCPSCGNDIGGENHKLVEREGHFRIYLNEAQKSNVENRSNYKPFKSMLLKDFKKNIIDKELSINKKGFNKILEKEFLDRNITVENIEPLTYRFLNFVLLSILYFNNNINESDFNGKIDTNKSFIDYILIDWNIMSKELQENKNIDIRIFIQLILPQFINCIKEYEDFSTSEKKNRI